MTQSECTRSTNVESRIEESSLQATSTSKLKLENSKTLINNNDKSYLKHIT